MSTLPPLAAPQPSARARATKAWPRRLTRLALVSGAAVGLAACGTKTPSSTATTAATSSATTAATGSAKSSSGTLTEAGSSLLYPLFQLWAPAYHTYDSSVTISPAAGGSGVGISDATAGTIDIGASDAYLSPAEMSATPSLENIPLAISAQMINYNVPGITKHLKLSGMILSDIYQGKITMWNDSAIAAINPGVKLPALKIVPLHRSDSSGDTFLFTTYLSDADPSGWGAKYSYNTDYPGPAISGALAENGNGGMVTGCGATKGCIAYIGISYLSMTNSAGLGEAMLENKSGDYLLPEATTISTEAAAFASSTPADESISMEYGSPAGGYPIINYEYAIVNAKQSSSNTATNIRSFLTWAINPADGNDSKYLDKVSFQALPTSVATESLTQINKIS